MPVYRPIGLIQIIKVRSAAVLREALMLAFFETRTLAILSKKIQSLISSQ